VLHIVIRQLGEVLGEVEYEYGDNERIEKVVVVLVVL